MSTDKTSLENETTPSCLGAVSGSLQAEAIEFAEWIRTFEPLEKKHGFWVLERQLSSEELYYHYLRDRERWRNDR